MSFVFAAFLVLAVAHKARAVTAGTASAEPLVAISQWRRHHATLLLCTVGSIELLICTALLVHPAVGFAALMALTLVYIVNLRKLSPDDGCNCFGSAFESRSRKAAVVRNVGVALISGVGAALYATSVVPVPAVSQVTVGLALLMAAALTALDLLRYVPRVESHAQSGG